MAKRKYNQTYLRFVRRPLEAMLLRMLVAFVKALPLDRASALGGFVGRTIGPRLPVSRRARVNLRLVFPAIDQSEIQRITCAMWDNLGRTFAEFPHLAEIVSLDNCRVECFGLDHAARLRDPSQAGIFVTGHLANWEAMAAFAHRSGFRLNTVVREPNNPLVRPILDKLRRGHHVLVVPKGASGARQLVVSLRNGEVAALLVDQKLNSGIAAPFFGIDAMSPPAPAQLALRFRCPIVPVRMERLGGAHFRLTFYPPLPLPDSGDREADVLALTTRINAILEDWIRDRPGDWFWLHRRWPKEVYAALDRGDA